MAVIIVGTERNVAELAPRLLGGVSSAPSAGRELADAIAAANPHVDPDALTPGAVLTVPDLPSAPFAGQLLPDPASMQAIVDLIDTGQAMLQAMTNTAVALEQEASVQRTTLAQVLDVVANGSAAKDPAVAAGVEAARERIAAADAGMGERMKGVETARVEWSAELQALKTLLAQ